MLLYFSVYFGHSQSEWLFYTVEASTNAKPSIPSCMTSWDDIREIASVSPLSFLLPQHTLLTVEQPDLCGHRNGSCNKVIADNNTWALKPHLPWRSACWPVEIDRQWSFKTENIWTLWLKPEETNVPDLLWFISGYAAIFFAVREISNVEGRQDWAGPHRHDWKTSCALIH